MVTIVNGQWVDEKGAPKSSVAPTNTSQSSAATSNEASTGTSSTNKSGSSSTSTQNMTAANQASLDVLIQQLLGGGTQQMQRDRAAKETEMGSLRTQRAGYSKEAAFGDAQGLMAQTLRQALEKLVPSINQGALGAGASQSSMRALLTQRAAENAAEAASAQGIGAAVQYGGVANGMSAILERLLAQQDPTASALLKALEIAKGAVSTSVTNYNDNTSGTTSNSGTKTTTGTENKSITALEPLVPPTSSGMQYFGPVATDQSIAIDNLKYTGTTADTLKQLAGLSTNNWSGYTF